MAGRTAGVWYALAVTGGCHMDETRESQEMPAVPLQYARVEAVDALRVYRLVGTVLLLYYCGTFAGGCMTIAGYRQMGMSIWTLYASQGVGVLLGVIGLAGAVGMVRLRRVGAWLIVGAAALQVGVLCLYFFVQALDLRSRDTAPFLVSAGPMTTSMLQSAAIALLAYLFWDLCRKRGAWGCETGVDK